MPISGRYVNAEAGRGRPCRIWTAGDIATATLYWHSGRGDLSDPATELFGEGKAKEIVVELFGNRFQKCNLTSGTDAVFGIIDVIDGQSSA